MHQTRTIDLPRNEAAPRAARAAIDDLTPVVDPRLIEDARLLVSEVTANSVVHGAGDQIRVVLDVMADDRLRCEVIDAGDGFVPVARDKGREEPGGWGLQLVEELAASWGVYEGSTHVWFELRAN